ncbi:MAG: DUF2798 domain-containing protein [Pseudomonadota bacterium]
MIPQRFAPVLFGLILSGLMSLIVSGIATLRALGWVDHLLAAWMESWLFSWAVAFPTVLVVAPIARRVVGRLTKPAQAPS